MSQPNLQPRLSEAKAWPGQNQRIGRPASAMTHLRRCPRL